MASFGRLDKCFALGRRIAEIAPGSDPLGRRTDYAHDDAGRLTSVTLPEVPDPDDPQTMVRPQYQYGYDLYGNRTSITDPEGHTTAFTYDHLGRQRTRVLPIGVNTTGDPNDFVEFSHYDDTPLATVQAGANPERSTAAGQRAYRTDFEGNVTAFLYDNTATGGGRLIEKIHYGGWH